MKTSAKEGYAPPILNLESSSGSRAKGSRITIRGDKDQGLSSSEGVWTIPTLIVRVYILVVLNALLVGVQCSRKDMCKAVEGPNTRPIVLSMISVSYFRIRRWLHVTIFDPDKTKLSSPFNPP